MGDGREVLVLAAGGNLGDGGHRDALVRDGNAVLVLQVVCGLYEILGRGRDPVVDLVAHAAHVLVGAARQADAHGDGAEVEVLLGDHREGLGHFLRSDVHLHAPLRLVR